MWGISHCLLLLWSALWTTENYHSCFYKSLRVCVCVCMHVSLHMAQGPVCGVNRRRVNTQAACSLHCYYPVCIISLINCSHQRHCPLKYCWASFQVKENRVGRGSSGPSTETCLRHNGKRNLVQRCLVALLKKNSVFLIMVFLDLLNSGNMKAPPSFDRPLLATTSYHQQPVANQSANRMLQVISLTFLGLCG